MNFQFKNFQKIFFILILFFGVFGLAKNSEASVLFEDNFNNQSNWKPIDVSECNTGDCAGQVPAGWSYYRVTGLWWPPEGQETIRINSDNYRGSFGKGYTQWNESNNGGSGDGWGADGILVKTFSSDYPELYARFWMKMKPGFQWMSNDNSALKIFRILHYDKTGNIFEGFPSGNLAPIYIFDLMKSLNYGWRHSHSHRCDPQATNYYCSPDYDTNIMFGDINTLSGDPGQAADGNWHQYDFHIKMNTYSGGAWNSNGVIEFSFDGVKKYSVSNIKWIQAGSETSIGWNMAGIGGSTYNTYTDPTNKAEQWYAIDDIVISTTSIPADYIIGGEAIDTTPPTAPQGLSVL